MTTKFDPFEHVTTPLNLVTIHNVLLVDVRQGEDGNDVLTIEHQGTRRDLPGGGKWGKFSLRDVGRYGLLIPMTPPNPICLNARGCYFRAYPDPSLRRLLELDRVDYAGTPQVGWVCDARPSGFTAPPGLIPGENGNFIPDETVEVILRVPLEFVRECRRVQRSPDEVLRGFVGDAAGIQNYVSCPRADGYSSNGSDERNMAEAWIERSYGVYAIDLDAADAYEEEEKQRQFERDDLGALLDDYVTKGGQADDLINAVQALVDKQVQP